MPTLLRVLGARYMQSRDEPFNFRGRLKKKPMKWKNSFVILVWKLVHSCIRLSIYVQFSATLKRVIIKMVEVCLNDSTSNKVIVTNYIYRS